MILLGLLAETRPDTAVARSNNDEDLVRLSF